MPFLGSTGSKAQVKNMLDNTRGTGLLVAKPTGY
jgi:hypothetical protein